MEENKIDEKSIISDSKIDLDNLSGFFDIVINHEHYKGEQNIYFVVDDFDIEKVEKIVSAFSEFISEYDFILKGILLLTQEEMSNMDEKKLDKLNEIFGEDPVVTNSNDKSILKDSPNEVIGITKTDMKLYQLTGMIDNLISYYGHEHSGSVSQAVPEDIDEKIKKTFENIIDDIDME